MTAIAITYPFPLGKANGGARMTREIARHLGRLGVQVTILPVSASPASRYPRPPAAPDGLGLEFDEEMARDQVQVLRVPQHPAHWLLDGLMVRRELGRLLARQKVDAVLSYYQEAAFLPGFLRRRGVRFGYISTWQSYALALGEDAREAPRRKRLRKWTNNRFIRTPHRAADVLFPTSAFTREELVSLLGVDGARAQVCYLGVEPGFLGIPRPPLAGPPRDAITRFIFFGRYVPSKGVADALEVLGRLRAEGQADLEFRMMGQGDRGWVRGLAEKFGVAEQVTIGTAVGDADLRAALEWADVALMPSHAEAFGLSIAEAQAAGLPVIAYAAGSVPEVVADGETGWLAPFREVAGLAEAIRQAVADPVETHRRGRAGRVRVAARFTWENTARTILTGVEALL